MAAEGSNDRENLEAIRSLQELFGGRFTESEIAYLYEFNNCCKVQTANYIFEANPSDITQLLEEEKKAWDFVKKKRKNIPRNIMDRAKSGEILTTTRMFACSRRHCDKSWWRVVPDRKMVSKCFTCKTRYDALPRNKEWGLAEFKCENCGKQFRGFCHMEVPSPCYKCSHNVLPIRILPPRRGNRPRGLYKHSCSCCMGYEPGGILRCAHPSTRLAHGLARVINGSSVHDSTGSTVNTFLPQEDLTMEYYPVLSSIPEN